MISGKHVRVSKLMVITWCEVIVIVNVNIARQGKKNAPAFMSIKSGYLNSRMGYWIIFKTS